MKKENIVIIGCGIAGMLTALGLSKYGIKSMILERKNKQALENIKDPRTTALNESTIAYLKKIDLWQNLNKYSQEIKDIFVCQNLSNDVLNLKSDDVDLGYMIENIPLRKQLFSIARKDENINILYSSEYKIKNISDEDVILKLKTPEEEFDLRAKLCLSAEGKFSDAKNDFFDEKYRRDYKQLAIVFNISHEIDHESGAIEHFLPRGTFATLPLKGGYNSSIVWVEDSEYASFLVESPVHILEEQVFKFSGGALGNVKIETKPEAFPLSAHVTQLYHKGMLALIADSAHHIHPLAGQGLNMGIRDVSCIVELIKEYNDLGLVYDLEMLEEYQRQRKFDNLNMFRITDTINSVFTSKSPLVNKVTTTGISILENIPFIKKKLISYAKGMRKN
jgi:2-octaprenyl-6-methoxyphenol hydroxylase